jgi:hypothetical protein
MGGWRSGLVDAVQIGPVMSHGPFPQNYARFATAPFALLDKLTAIGTIDI